MSGNEEEPTRTASEISKLQEMSAKYGISVETLRLIQKKKVAEDKSMNITKDIIASQTTSSKINQLHKLIDNLHHQFIMKQKQVLPYSAVLQALCDKTNNSSQLSSTQIASNLTLLASLVSANLSIKVVGDKKMVKFHCSSGLDKLKQEVEGKMKDSV